MSGAADDEVVAWSGKYNGAAPIMAFEFSETTGTTAYDTGTSGAGRTASLSTGINFAEFDGKRVVDCSPTATGAVISGSDVICSTGVPFSLEFYVYVDAVTDLYPSIFRLKTNKSNGFQFDCGNVGGYVGLLFGGADGEWYLGRDNVPITQGYLHAVLTYNGGSATVASSFKLYRSGNNSPIVSAGGFANTSNVSVLFGRDRTDNQFDGKCDFVRVYNYALSQAQVTELYNLRNDEGLF
jgi:hypothetical protein